MSHTRKFFLICWLPAGNVPALRHLWQRHFKYTQLLYKQMLVATIQRYSSQRVLTSSKDRLLNK